MEKHKMYARYLRVFNTMQKFREIYTFDCYVHFRDILKHKLSERAIKNLDRHIVDEYATSPNILVDGACPTGE